MTYRTAVLAVISLIALTGAMGLWTTGCGGGLDTPEGVTVELLRAVNQFDSEVSTSLLDTTNLPLTLRFLIASSEDDYGLIVSADADGTAVPSCFPASAVVNQVYYGYRCVSPYPYPLWVAVSLIADPSTGAMSFTKDGERNQFWVAATKDVSVTFVSVTPSGYTVGAPRQFFFSKDAVLVTDITVIGISQTVTIVVGQVYFLNITGYIDWTNFPSQGIPVYVDVNGVPTVVGTLYLVNGQPAVIFGPGLTALLQTIPAGQVQQLTCYFTLNGVQYPFVIWVTGTGGASSANIKPVASISLSYSGMTVTGNASGSYDPDGSIASYVWNFGDGSIGVSGVTASYTYTTAGTYTITLTITDNSGGSSSQTATVVITGGGGTGSGTINVYPEEV